MVSLQLIFGKEDPDFHVARQCRHRLWTDETGATPMKLQDLT
jgi:hypothetical protein